MIAAAPTAVSHPRPVRIRGAVSRGRLLPRFFELQIAMSLGMFIYLAALDTQSTQNA